MHTYYVGCSVYTWQSVLKAPKGVGVSGHDYLPNSLFPISGYSPNSITMHHSIRYGYVIDGWGNKGGSIFHTCVMTRSTMCCLEKTSASFEANWSDYTIVQILWVGTLGEVSLFAKVIQVVNCKGMIIY